MLSYDWWGATAPITVSALALTEFREMGVELWAALPLEKRGQDEF